MLPRCPPVGLGRCSRRPSETGPTACPCRARGVFVDAPGPSQGPRQLGCGVAFGGMRTEAGTRGSSLEGAATWQVLKPGGGQVPASHLPCCPTAGLGASHVEHGRLVVPAASRPPSQGQAAPRGACSAGLAPVRLAFTSSPSARVSPRAPRGLQVRRPLLMPGLGFARHTPGPGCEELSAPRCQHQCRGPRSAALLPSLETLFPPARKCGWAQQWTAGAGGAGTASASFLSRPPVSRAVPCAAPCQAWPSPFTACGLWRDPSGGVGSRSDWEIWPAASRGDSLTPRASRGRFAFPLPRQLSGLQGEDENPLKEAGKSGLRSPPNSFCIFFSMCHHVLENHCQGDKTSADSKAASDRRGLCVPAWFQPLVWQLLECVHRLSGDRPAHDSARRPARRPLLARPLWLPAVRGLRGPQGGAHAPSPVAVDHRVPSCLSGLRVAPASVQPGPVTQACCRCHPWRVLLFVPCHPGP